MIIPEASLLGLFVVAAIVLLLTPGPAVLYIVTRSVAQGRWPGWSRRSASTWAPSSVAAAALRVSALLVSSALAFDIVKYLGALYLIYLGVRKLAAGWDQPARGQAIAPSASAGSSVRAWW